MKTVVICGAGADKAAGMPLASELVPKIKMFLENTGDGKSVDNYLRDVLPYLRFTYNSLVDDAVRNILDDHRDQISIIVANINKELGSSVINEGDRTLGVNIIKVLDGIQEGIKKLKNIHDYGNNVQITPEIRRFLDESGSQRNLFPVDEVNVIDLLESRFTEEFKKLTHDLLSFGLREPNHRILRHLTSNLMSLESLLTDSFSGFDSEDAAKIKRYIYQAWTLWAYLKHKENVAYSKYPDGKPLPFYSSLPSGWDMITLNYTSFARKCAERTGGKPPYYFHGDLSSFTRMDDGEKYPISENIAAVEFIKSTVANETRFGGADDSYVLPCLIPPSKNKPALSGLIGIWDFNEVWHKSKEILDNADKIIIVGYSFSYNDNHLNHLIKRNKHKNILIVDRYPETIRVPAQNIFSYRPEDYVESRFQGKICYVKDKLKIVGAKATDIDWSDI